MHVSNEMFQRNEKKITSSGSLKTQSSTGPDCQLFSAGPGGPPPGRGPVPPLMGRGPPAPWSAGGEGS